MYSYHTTSAPIAFNLFRQVTEAIQRDAATSTSTSKAGSDHVSETDQHCQPALGGVHFPLGRGGNVSLRAVRNLRKGAEPMRRYELSTWIVPAVETSAGGITHTSTAKPEAVHDCVVNPVTVPDVFAQLGQFWGRAPAAVYTLPVRPRVQQAAHIPASPTPTFSYQYEEEEEEDMDPIPPQYNTLDGREIFFRHSPANPLLHHQAHALHVRLQMPLQSGGSMAQRVMGR